MLPTPHAIAMLRTFGSAACVLARQGRRDRATEHGHGQDDGLIQLNVRHATTAGHAANSACT
jgi:hypothetical protein